jgi:hypothetical protein
MSRRGCSLPANASGADPHRASISSRFGQVFTRCYTRLFWTKNGELVRSMRVELEACREKKQSSPSSDAARRGLGAGPVLLPAVGLAAGHPAARVRFNFDGQPAQSGAFRFDIATGLPREPDCPGMAVTLAPDFAAVADAEQGPLKPPRGAADGGTGVGKSVGIVQAVDGRSGECLVQGWWYRAPALCCRAPHPSGPAAGISRAGCPHPRAQLTRPAQLTPLARGSPRGSTAPALAASLSRKLGTASEAVRADGRALSTRGGRGGRGLGGGGGGGGGGAAAWPQLAVSEQVCDIS